MNALYRVSLRRILSAIFQKEYGRVPVHYAGRVFWKPLGAIFGPNASKDTTTILLEAAWQKLRRVQLEEEEEVLIQL